MQGGILWRISSQIRKVHVLNMEKHVFVAWMFKMGFDAFVMIFMKNILTFWNSMITTPCSE